jgi:hypothetical protein
MMLIQGSAMDMRAVFRSKCRPGRGQKIGGGTEIGAAPVSAALRESRPDMVIVKAENLIDFVADVVEQVLIPGDPERKTRAERGRTGVPLPDDTWAAIVSTAREVGVSEVSIQRATS